MKVTLPETPEFIRIAPHEQTNGKTLLHHLVVTQFVRCRLYFHYHRIYEGYVGSAFLIKDPYFGRRRVSGFKVALVLVVRSKEFAENRREIERADQPEAYHGKSVLFVTPPDKLSRRGI